MTSRSIPLPRAARRSRTRAAGQGPRVVPLLFFTFLVVAVFFAMIYLRIALDRTAFELDGIERSIELEESRQLDLRLSIAELQDPVRIATEAQRIGMTTPEERRSLILVTGTRDVAPPPALETPISALNDGRP
jgi:cell division protein FtsL